MRLFSFDISSLACVVIFFHPWPNISQYLINAVYFEWLRKSLRQGLCPKSGLITLGHFDIGMYTIPEYLNLELKIKIAKQTN